MARQCRVFGANPYYWQASICRAALHAGVLGVQGGQVVVTSAPDVPVFPAVNRNGVVGESYHSDSGFQVAAVPGAAPVVATAKPVDASAGTMVLDVCPTSYASFPNDGPTMTCGCTPAAMKEGRVVGANPYYWQASICRAALHAGVLGAQGGQVVVTSAPDVPVFPAVNRNGVVGESYHSDSGFRVSGLPGATLPLAAVLKPAVDAAGQPVQAPVAATLKETGTVALYIRFRFNSADLDISAASTLMQLRDALVSSPDLRLLLVGHTDAVGGRDYNRNLSLKRAQSVMLWLRDQGVIPERLAIDGKGFDEPVADNDTDTGRTLNRRVQAIRIQ
jgi:outer membrane protein OmpA-like peptidoglycan-associated protein